MKQKRLMAAALFAGATLLASCGKGGFPSYDGKYATNETIESIEDWDGALGNAMGLASKKISFNYQENIEVKVNDNGGKTDFTKFRTKVTATTEGYIDFSMANFYAYVKTTYVDVNNPETNYVKEGLIRASDTAAGTYEMITTDDTSYTNLGPVQAAFGATFTLTETVSKTKGTRLGADAFIVNGAGMDTWLYNLVGLKSTAGNGVEDWEDVKPTLGTNEAGELIIKTEAPMVGYETDQGMSDFGASSKGHAAYVQAKVGADGYLTDWAVDYNGENAALEFNIMTPAPTVIVTGNRVFSANYAAAEQTHKTEIEHAEPSETKYATWNVVADTGVASYTVTRMVIEGQNPTGMADITLAGKDEVVANLWFAVKLTLKSGVEVTSVKVGDQDAFLMSGFYCAKADQEGEVKFVVTTTGASEVATANVVKSENVTEAVVKVLTAPNFSVQTPVTEEGATIGAAQYLVCLPVLADGAEIDHVLVNGVDVTATAATYGGFYGVNIPTAGLYQFSIVTK